MKDMLRERVIMDYLVKQLRGRDLTNAIQAVSHTKPGTTGPKSSPGRGRAARTAQHAANDAKGADRPGGVAS